jgi:hypothetical protein
VAEQGGAYLDQVRARLAEELPHLGSPNLRPVQIIEVYARLIAVAVARAEFYGRLLAQAYEDEGIGALVGHKYAVAITRSGDTETSAPWPSWKHRSAPPPNGWPATRCAWAWT